MKTKHYSSLLPLALLATIIALLGPASPAQAELRRFVLEYTNTSNTRAQAGGYILIDDDPSVFDNSSRNDFPFRQFVKDIQITISRATDPDPQREPSPRRTSPKLDLI